MLVCACGRAGERPRREYFLAALGFGFSQGAMQQAIRCDTVWLELLLWDTDDMKQIMRCYTIPVPTESLIVIDVNAIDINRYRNTEFIQFPLFSIFVLARSCVTTKTKVDLALKE